MTKYLTSNEEIIIHDIDYIIDNTISLWKSLKDCRIFITGGTGFFGKWMLRSLVQANDKLGLNLNILLLSRNPEKFIAKEPKLAMHKCIKLHIGDMCSFDYPNGAFKYVIHAATETNNENISKDPFFLFRSNLRGAEHILEFSKLCNASSLLITSSGAVYGNRYCKAMNNVSEAYQGAPLTTDIESVYGNGKRTIELLSALYSDRYGLDIKIARCFTFVGPYLPLKKNYAVGNFIFDALSGRNIEIKGDGTPRRSYMYMADLIVWILTILIKGKNCYPYNVGSNIGISILDLAKLVCKIVNPYSKINLAKKSSDENTIEYYVPSTERAKKELGLNIGIQLEEAIKRTAEWYFPTIKKLNV